jgi:microsomal dipeptidase-like Zn-dependent dipeptidase
MKKGMNEQGITRRSFIKGMAIGGATLYASKMLGNPSEGWARERVDIGEHHDKAHLKRIRIIDAHAHPDRYKSQDTVTDSLEDIKELGMVASVFAAIGDNVFLSNGGIQGTNEYHYTISQLDYWLSGGSSAQKNGIVESGDVKLVLKSHDIPKFLDPKDPVPGAILAIEGGDALEGKVRRVNEFYGLGVRLITIIHYRNNELGDTMMPHAGGPPPGPYNGGLTKTGQEVIERMRELGMIVDVAHADHNTLMDILDMKIGPVIDSHTSLCTEFTNPVACGLKRLRTWDEMEAIAKSGGVVCNWPKPTPNRHDFRGWANELMEMKHNLGIQHVGIGTDGGGSLPDLITGYHDVRNLAQLIAAMQEVGFSHSEIAAIMGGNFYRVLKHCIG